MYIISPDELKTSRIYYELTIPRIVKKSLFIIFTIFCIGIIYVIFAPYNVVVKCAAQIRPEQDLVYITPITSGIIKEKLFKNGQKVTPGQTLYILDNSYIHQELKMQNDKKAEYESYINKNKEILTYLEKCLMSDYETNSKNLAILSLNNHIKRLHTELKTTKQKYETEKMLFPQSSSKFDVQEAENNYNFAKISLDNYICENKIKYSDELKNYEMIISEIESTIAQLKLQLDQTVLKSTCAGFIEELQIMNTGESIVAETQIARIIPEKNEKFKVFLNVNVQDIAELKEENEFTLSFPKYPSSNFSSVRGRIVSVSKDANYSNCGESYFLVKGIINDTSFYDRRNKNKINLIPGMKATARIKVRTEPLYLYIFKHLEL